ncbi:hypothetical protein Vretifemale_17179, partial [Volvox reticuliferus]
MPGIVFTPRRFRVFCNRLSSVDVVLCTAFFFLLTEPLPPVRTAPAIFISLSRSMLVGLADPNSVLLGPITASVSAKRKGFDYDLPNVDSLFRKA